MYLAWETDPCDAGWPYLCFCVYQQQSHPCMLYLSTFSPRLRDGDGVGCTRANKHGIDGMTGLRAENMEH